MNYEDIDACKLRAARIGIKLQTRPSRLGANPCKYNMCGPSPNSRPLWSLTTSQLFILDRTFQLFKGGQFSITRSHSFSVLSTPTKEKNNRHFINCEARTISPAFERARMAFNIASGGPSSFGGNIGQSSNAQIQTGPDLEEISTDVG